MGGMFGPKAYGRKPLRMWAQNWCPSKVKGFKCNSLYSAPDRQPLTEVLDLPDFHLQNENRGLKKSILALKAHSLFKLDVGFQEIGLNRYWLQDIP